MLGAEAVSDLSEVDQTRMGIYVNQAYRECFSPTDGARTRWSSRSFSIHVPEAKDVTVVATKGENQVEIDSDFSSAYLGSFLKIPGSPEEFHVITKTESKVSVPTSEALAGWEVEFTLVGQSLAKVINLASSSVPFVDGVEYTLKISWSGSSSFTEGHLIDVNWEGNILGQIYHQEASTTEFTFTHNEDAGDGSRIMLLSTNATVEGDHIIATSMSFEDSVYEKPNTSVLTLQAPVLFSTGSHSGKVYYTSHVLAEELIDVSRNPEVSGRGALSSINSPEVAVAMRSWLGSDFRPSSDTIGRTPTFTSNGTNLKTDSHPLFYYIDNSALITDAEPVQCRFCLYPAPEKEHSISFTGNVIPEPMSLDTDKPRLPGNVAWDILLPIAQGKLVATDPRYNGNNKEMVMATAKGARQRLKTLSKTQKQKVLRLVKRRGW